MDPSPSRRLAVAARLPPVTIPSMKQLPESVFHISPQQAGQTLATFLRAMLPQHSWSEIRRLLRTRHVQVNGNLCLDAGRRLKTGEVVKLLPQSAAPLPAAEDIKIHYLDQHLVVVEKPSGATSVRHTEELSWPARRRQFQQTLDEMLPALIAKYEFSRGGRGKNRQGSRRNRGVPPPVRPVHRLDRDTSGLMVFARSVRAERHLGEQFRKHTTHRRYLAIVAGRVEKAWRFDTQLVRDRGDGRRGSAKPPQNGKRAVTHVSPLEHIDGYTLVQCSLETGRTHQIRIHLLEAGHPVCGDKVYRQPRPGAAMISDDSGAPRLALHAAELGFIHPITGEEMRFEMALPGDLAEFLKRLKRKRDG